MSPTISRWAIPLAAFIACVLTAIFFYDVVFTGQIFADRDGLLTYIPMFRFWGESIRAGRFPQWMTYDAMGEPFIGQVLGSPFHPFKVLFLLMEAGLAFKICTLLCFPLGFVGFCLLLSCFKADRRAILLGAILFTFNGYAVSITNNYPYLLGMMTTPWAFFLTARCHMGKGGVKGIFLAALGYAMILFGGETQSFLVACMGGCALAFILPECQERRKAAFLEYVAIMGTTAGITAVQWLPSILMFRDAVPGSVGKEGASVAWSFHPLRTLELLFGGISGTSFLSERFFSVFHYHYDEMGQFWARTVVFGLPAFCLAVLGASRKDRVRIFLAVSALVTFLCLLGKHVGLYSLFQFLLPFLRPLRYPEKLFSILMLLLSAMAAFGMHDIVSKKGTDDQLAENVADGGKLEASSGEGSRRLEVVLLLSCVTLCLGAWIGEEFLGFWSNIMVQGVKTPSIREQLLEEIHSGTALMQSVALGGMVVSALCWHRKRQMLPYVAASFAAVFLFLGTRGSYQPAIPDMTTVSSSPVEALKPVLPSDASNGVPLRTTRISSRTNASFAALQPNLDAEARRIIIIFGLDGMYPSLFGIDSGNVSMPGASRRYMSIASSFRSSPLFSMGASSLFSSGAALLSEADFQKLSIPEKDILFASPLTRDVLVRLPNARPRAYLARPIWVDGEAESLTAVKDAVSEMMNDKMNLEGRAILERGSQASDVGEGTSSQVGKDSSTTSDPTTNLGTAKIVSYLPEHVALEVDALEDGLALVLNDAFYSGWIALVDGKISEIVPANHVARAVLVPKGNHRVEFIYFTPGLGAGAAISTLTMLSFLIAGIWRGRRKKILFQKTSN